MAYTTTDIRNIALVGHAASGKTTLTEALLVAAGQIPVAGDIERGNTVCDFDALEQEKQHSLDTALVSFDWEGCHVNLLDTPGSPDFLGKAVAALPAVETAAVVVNARAGVEMVTTRIMRRAEERGLCRLIIVNGIDAEDVDPASLLAELQETFGKECLPLNLPADNATRVVDCFFNPAGDSDFSSVPKAHQDLVDQVVEVNEELMTLYLEQGEELAPEQLHEPFEQALREGHLIPVCFVSARTGEELVKTGRKITKTALAKLDTLRDENRLQVWLTQIMANLYRDQFRRVTPDTGLEGDLLAGSDDPEQAINASQLASRTREAIASLNEDQRQVLTLVDLAGFSYSDTAAILDVPVGTIMSRLSRARRRMRELLKQQGIGHADVIPLRRPQ